MYPYFDASKVTEVLHVDRLPFQGQNWLNKLFNGGLDMPAWQFLLDFWNILCRNLEISVHV